MLRSKCTTICVSMIVVTVLGLCVVRSKFWQKLQIEEAWCEDQVAVGEQIVAALELYRQRFGAYPISLDDLVPAFLAEIPSPVAHPSGNGGDKWIYRRLDDDRFYLCVTVLHWVSTFDAFVYSSSGVYPDEWGKKHYVQKVGEWLYVVGAQELTPSVVAPSI